MNKAHPPLITHVAIAAIGKQQRCLIPGIIADVEVVVTGVPAEIRQKSEASRRKEFLRLTIAMEAE
jgi:hypothetical protein